MLHDFLDDRRAVRVSASSLTLELNTSELSVPHLAAPEVLTACFRRVAEHFDGLRRI